MTADEIPGLKRGQASMSRMDRLPPYSAEAEQGVLGCVLMDPEVLEMARERLTCGPAAFYDLRHRTIWEAIERSASEGRPIDMIALGQVLKDAGELEVVGGLQYLSECADAVPSAANLPHYLELVIDLHQRREVLRVGTEMVAEAYSGRNGAELLALATERIGAVADATPQTTTQPVVEVLREIITEIEDFSQGRKQMRGLSSGVNYLDNMTCGWKPEEFIILAGRPGGGKTALAMQFVEAVAVHARQPVGFFSLEMSRKSLLQRLLFSVSGVDFQKYRNGFLKQTDFALLTRALEQMKGAPVMIDDTSNIHCEDLEIRARKWVRNEGVKLIVIDYLQLMGGRRGARYGGENLVMQVGDASATIMRLKKELGVPFIVLAQENTNRERAERERKPLLSDLKDSQKPAQDADVVMFLYDVNLERARRGLHAKDEETRRMAEAQFAWRQSKSVLSLPKEILDDEEKNLKRVNLYVAKQRNGPTGDCALVMVKPWMRFIDAYVAGEQTVRQAAAGDGSLPGMGEEFGEEVP